MNPNLSDGAKAFLTAGAAAGGMVSDGPVREGWALAPFVGGKAHHWTKLDEVGTSARVESACGLMRYVTEAAPLLGLGSFKRCQRCEQALLRQK